MRFRLTVAAVTVAVLAAIPGAPALADPTATAGGTAPASSPAGMGGPRSVASLARRLAPAVVNISSMHHAGKGAAAPRALDDSSSGQSLDDTNPDDPGQVSEDSESLGSGFIISADGLIVTNNHVIEGADQVQVFLTDGTHWPAQVMGTDSKTDIALLKIEAGHTLPFVQFGDSDAAQVGDWVMAIGNPFGLGGSVTLGIVSARNRDIQSGPYDSYIQTDASINQGNSGGPLFDMNGKVVGINSAIVAEGGSSLGIGFAIPGNLAKPVVDQLAQFGETRRGWLGVGIQEVTDSIAASLGLTDTHGAMVTDITKSGPADGVLAEGDVIRDFDGKPIEAMHDLPRLVAETAVGKVVPVEVFRAGKEQVFTVTLGRLEDGTDRPRPGRQNLVPVPKAPAPEHETLDQMLGFHLAPIDPANRKAYALAAQLSGLVITSVKAGSDADQEGLAPGYVVTGANLQKVDRLADVQAVVDAARRAGHSAVLFKVVDPAGAGRLIGVKFEG